MTGPVPFSVSPGGPVFTRSPARSEVLSPERAELRKAAEGFEAIMVRKLLATARASSFAEDTPLTGGGLKQFQTMRDEQVADLVAASGTLGFARSIEASLAQHLPAKGDV